MKKTHTLLAIIVSSTSLLFHAIPGNAHSELEQLMQNPQNWASWGGDYAATRYSKLDQINRDNVKNLAPAWTMSTGVLRGHEGGPLVINDPKHGINGVIFIHTPYPHRILALDQKTRTILWKYEYKPAKGVSTQQVVSVMCCDTVSRGLAYAEGKIFMHQADTSLIALDARPQIKDKDGDKLITQADRVLWTMKTGDPKLGQTNTNAPLIVKDKIITGVSGGEFGVRGWLAAYYIRDGSLAWKGYSMGPDEDVLMNPKTSTSWQDGEVKPVGKDSSLKSWEGDQWKVGGGTTWGWYSYDPELNLIYYGSGNPSTWNPVQRPGDNKWSMSLWARDADSGEVKWVYQMTPHDEWDFDGINEVALLDLKIKGKLRKTAVHIDRNGFGYTLDRVTGELLIAEKYDHSVNWATHVDMKTGRPQVVAEFSTEQNGEDETTSGICPAALGSKNQQPVAYSPKTGLVYIPGNHVCMNYEPFEVEYTAGQPYVGAVVNMFPAGRDVLTGEKNGSNNLGQFTAWDAAKGKIIWSKKEPFSVWSGALATAGDVVFYGTLEGFLKAVDAKTGEELYRFKTPSGIIGNVSTWVFEGKQYIGVLSGLGGWAGIGMVTEVDTDVEGCGMGACKAYKGLDKQTALGGVFSVFTLPD